MQKVICLTVFLGADEKTVELLSRSVKKEDGSFENEVDNDVAPTVNQRLNQVTQLLHQVGTVSGTLVVDDDAGIFTQSRSRGEIRKTRLN